MELDHLIKLIFQFSWLFLIGMASQEPIEKLYVKLEADVRDLLTKGEDAITKLERKMDELDRKGKKVGRFTQLRAGLDKLVRGIRAAQAAFVAFSAALVAAWRLAQQAVSDLRVERSFYSLANAAQQSGEQILKAMRDASRGAVDDLTLMQQANLAMQLGVAKTPEEFEKLTRSAIALGAAVGRGPVEAINDLVIAAGRRSRLVLDNLGLSLGEVNRLMAEFAQQDFGKTVDQLDQIQRDMLFTRATIEAANRKAAQLGGNLEDAGTDIEAISAQAANFRREFSQTTLIFVSLLNSLGQGPGILKRLQEGAIAWQRILIQISALVMAINDTLDSIGLKMRDFGKLFDIKEMVGLGAGGRARGLIWKILRGEQITEDDWLPGIVKVPRAIGERIGQGLMGADSDVEGAGDSLGTTFAESFQKHLEELETRFQDILDPEAAAAEVGLTVPPLDTTDLEDSTDEVRDIVDDLATDMMDAAQERQDALEELEADHEQRMADIMADGARKEAEINRRLQRDLEDLARDTEQRREEIFRDAQRDLEDLARDTDEALADERHDFQTEERRDTEDHLRDMRRLTEQYLYDLEDAVKERDARAVVDLQRRFAMESQRREEDFDVKQTREREDFDERLAEIRQNEARRREEILRNREQELMDLMRNEQQRRAELMRNHAEQLADLQANLEERRARENQNYLERQTDLQNALTQRLQTIARELADEEKLNAQGARRILEILNEYFGVGGDIDQLMNSFAARRRQRMVIDIAFESTGQLPSAYGLAPGTRTLPPGFRFQRGGQMLAKKPTLAMFGEAGPELANFIPLNQMGEAQPRPQKLQIEFSGSAPPGIRATERDQIANVLLNALRDTGMISR